MTTSNMRWSAYQHFVFLTTISQVCMFDTVFCELTLYLSHLFDWYERFILHTHIPTSSWFLSTVQAAAAVPGEAAAKAECARVSAKRKVARADVAALLTACTPALPSPAVAEALLNTIAATCDEAHPAGNRVACGAAGIIPTVLSAMSAHGPESATIATAGCNALSNLAIDNAVNADDIVLFGGGAGVLCTSMSAHAGNEAVQRRASFALSVIVGNGSPAALTMVRESRAVALLKQAREKHGGEGEHSVQHWATLALTKLEVAVRCGKVMLVSLWGC